MSDVLEYLKQLETVDLHLRAERLEIFSYLREQKERDMLFMMLENNINAARRVSCMKEHALTQQFQTKEQPTLTEDDIRAFIEDGYPSLTEKGEGLHIEKFLEDVKDNSEDIEEKKEA